MRHRLPSFRRGAVLPITVICLVGLCAFVALAVDLGMLAVSRTQCQNAADAAAMAGTRYLNTKPTSVDGNRANAIAQATSVAQVNPHVGTQFTDTGAVSVVAGQYLYDTTNLKFQVSYPSSIPSGQAWTAMKVTVTGSQPTYFMKVFGIASMPTGAVAVAVHRPRDIALVIDMTGSMGYSSKENVTVGLNDPNTSWPQYAHYQRYIGYNTSALGNSETGTPVSTRPNPLQQMQTLVSAPYVYSPANLTIETSNGKAIVRDYFYDTSNLTNPATPVTSTDGTNFRNAFHQWSPSESGGDPLNNIGPTYAFTGYNALDTTGTTGSMPAPDNFKDQSDTPIAYAGDKSPRKYGATTGTTWDPTNANGAAVTAAEYLGWVSKYSGGTTLPNTIPAAASGRAWTNFRDAVWERYGYDLDVADYVSKRNNGGTWDPRYDWDKTANGGAGGWAHQRTTDPTGTYRPSVTAGTFKGYSMGPGYFGKTFFVWPPDPRTPVGNPGDANYVPGDWRVRYFFNRNGVAFNTQIPDQDPITGGNQNIDEELLTNGTGDTLNTASGNWGVNYAAVLKWIKSGPMTLPPNLRSGHVVYYSSIPDTVTASAGDSAAVAADKVFWKTYIDYVLKNGSLAGPEPAGWPEGVTPAVDQNGLSGYVYKAGATADPLPYTDYTDNPSRPRLHFWFGPNTMMHFLNNYNMWSGSTHQAQSWQLKAGVNSALDDMRNNHPNDTVGMAFFTTPNYNSIIVPIGQDYTSLKNSLFFPRNQLTNLLSDPTAEWRPYDATNGLRNINSTSGLQGEIPNAQSSTDPVSGLSLGFNLLSPSSFVNSNPARRGRRGAAKVVIFETDGIPNSTQTFTLQKLGYDSYYKFVSSSTTGTAPDAAAVAIVQQIVKPIAATNTSGTDSGMSLPNAPARVYAIGFGDIFSTSAGPTAATFLLQIQQAGNTSAATDTSIPATQIITGPYPTRIANLRTALQNICQAGVQVTLIE
jgi:Flp pilus assembly protein TadG